MIGRLQFDNFYHGFMQPYFGCYQCVTTKKAIHALWHMCYYVWRGLKCEILLPTHFATQLIYYSTYLLTHYIFHTFSCDFIANKPSATTPDKLSSLKTSPVVSSRSGQKLINHCILKREKNYNWYTIKLLHVLH